MRINLNSNSDLNNQNNNDETRNALNYLEANNAFTEGINHQNININSRHIVTEDTENNQSVELTPNEFIIALHDCNLPHASIIVTGDVRFENKDMFYFYFPNKVIIKGKLTIKNCNNITQISSSLHVDSLSIKNCNNFTKFEADIVINQKLKIHNCNKISKLPPDLEINDLNIENCNKIVLSNNIRVKKKLTLCNCLKIISLPIISTEIEFIIIDNLKNLILQKNFVIKGELYLRCYKPPLPENMIIEGNLILDYCNLLEYLPDYLTVKGSILISNCSAITDLPSIWLSDMPSSLPFTDYGFHTLLLDKTSISRETINYYDSILSKHIILTDISLESFYTIRSLKELIDCWKKKTDNKNYITAEEYKDVFGFLYKLMNTKTFLNKVTNNNLASQVVNILKLIKDNNKMKEEILLIIHDAVSECEDRVLLSLADIEFLPLLQQAEQQSINDKEGKSLKELGRKKFIENEILNYAVIQAKIKGAEKEEVEFILAYKIKLANKFNLNSTTISMNYAEIPNVTDADIKLAYEKITAKTTDCYFDKWLGKWEPLQKHKRKWSLKKYTQLTMKSANETNIKAKDKCIISAESSDEITDLVIYNKQIYRYESLCDWYIAKGTDPLNPEELIDINNIFAIKIPDDNPNIFYKKAKKQ